MKAKLTIFAGMSYLFLTKATGVAYAQTDATIKVNESDLGFKIPNMTQFLTFMIRFFFVLAGLMALFYMLWGALEWVTSGGDGGKVDAARKKIIAAVIGVILIVATLAIIVALEQIVFKGAICFGLSCPVTLPTLLTTCDSPETDADCDGLPNATDPDTDGDRICDAPGTDPNANPGKADTSCDGGATGDTNDDNDCQDDSTDPEPRNPRIPCGS